MKKQKEKMLKKAEAVRKSDVIANRLYILFFGAVLAVFGLIRLGNSISAQLKFVEDIQLICVVVSAAILISAIVYKFICAKKGKDETYTSLSSGLLLILAASLFGIITLFGKIDSKILLAYVIIGTVLYFVYNIYEREFFWYSLYTAVAYFVLSMGFAASNTASLPQIIVTVASVAIAIAVTVVVVVSKQRGGTLVLFGKKLGKFSKTGAYPFYVTTALIIAGMLLALFVSGISMYSLVVLFASYMIFAVIYTIKLM